MDPARLEEAITMRTQAIIPVHLFGNMADMDALCAIARRYGTPVIEDAVRRTVQSTKADAQAASVSLAVSAFTREKIGAFGEAGAITSDESELRIKIQALRDHGQNKHQHSTIGWNARMNGFRPPF